jgi:hypothetical protein
LIYYTLYRYVNDLRLAAFKKIAKQLKTKGNQMDQRSIINSFLLHLFLSGLLFNGMLVIPNEPDASELPQIAQSSAGEDDDEDDDDC